MKTITAQDLLGHLRDVGFPENKRITALAIALCETHGSLQTDAVNPTSGATGVWQILPSAHRDVSRDCMLDPACATRAMFKIYREGTKGHRNRFTPWECFTDGVYRQYLRRAARQFQIFMKGLAIGAGLPPDEDARLAAALAALDELLSRPLSDEEFEAELTRIDFAPVDSPEGEDRPRDT